MRRYLLYLLAFWSCPMVFSQEEDAANLAAELANPIASIYSVPVQNNIQFMTGPTEETQFLINFQPVIPISLGEKINLITRTIVPIINKPLAGDGTIGGLGEILHSDFISPNNDSHFIWGAGPAFLLKSATSSQLGTMKWAIGPTAVGLYQKGRITAGALINQLWSVGGDPNRPEVSRMFFQPFFVVAMGDQSKGATMSLNSEMIANWKAVGQERWTVPINLIYNQVIYGGLPLQLGLGGGYYVARTDNSPNWQLRVNFILVIPKG